MEKRKYQRVSVDLPVTIRHQGKLIPATAVNVSCGGMYLKTEGEGLSLNTPIEVTFDLNDETRDVSLCGVVSLIEGDSKPRFGVEFANFFSAGHKALREFLRRHSN